MYDYLNHFSKVWWWDMLLNIDKYRRDWSMLKSKLNLVLRFKFKVKNILHVMLIFW